MSRADGAATPNGLPPPRLGLSALGSILGSMSSSRRRAAAKGGEAEEAAAAEEEEEVIDARILIEVVSATDLPSPRPSSAADATTGEAPSDPFCVVRRAPPPPSSPPSSSSPSSSSSSPPSPSSSSRSSSSRRRRRRDGAAAAGDELHRTLPVRRTLRPIWTVRTRSLCLLSVNVAAFERTGGLEFEVLDASSPSFVGSVSGWEDGGGRRSRRFSHGRVRVPPERILAGSGERIEFRLRGSGRSVAWGDGRKAREEERPVAMGVLALRFRAATEGDLEFMRAYEKGGGYGRSPSVVLRREMIEPQGPCDFNFGQERPTWGHHRTKGTGTDRKYVVQPCPDPDRPDRTYMTESEIESASFRPSRNWVRAGTGAFGTLHLEVLGCDGLPDMDIDCGVGAVTGRPNKTDAFVAALYEDTLVRTSVVFDCLSPRWMPWSQRAFAFPVKHPCSVLTLGVFDYDRGPMNYHDPIGRIVIDPMGANLENRTVYNLRYTLHSDPCNNDDQGTVRVRLRVDLTDERRFLLKSFGSPARYHINVNGAKAYQVLRYLCRGQINMDKASMKTVSLYASELVSYFEYYLYVIDFLIGVLLWRGRVDLSLPLPRWVSVCEEEEEEGDGDEDGRDDGAESSAEGRGSGRRTTKKPPSSRRNSVDVSIWFPIHSVALFEAGIIVVESPSLLPAMLFFGAAWIMATVMFHRSGHPSPWNQCKSIGEITSVILLGRNVHAPDAIRENEGAEEAAVFEAVNKAKTERIVSFLMALKTAALKYKREYYKTDAEALAIETEDKEWSLFESQLYYVHLGLSYLCIYLRGMRNVMVWRASSYSYVLTAACLLLGLTCAFLPMDVVLLWSARAWVWTFLGPWMKLVDIFYVQSLYRTRKELTANPDIQEPEVESLFRGEKYERLAKLVRVAAEDALKLKHMRECRFGAYSALVPSFDHSRFPSVPLPESTAEPYHGEEDDARDAGREWTFVPGQRLRGTMIPVTEDLSVEADEEAKAHVD